MIAPPSDDAHASVPGAPPPADDDPIPEADPATGPDANPEADPEAAAESGDPAARARALRQQLAAYVAALHEACVAATAEAGHEPSDLLLADAPFTVAIIAGRGLHVVATRDELPPLRDHEQVPVGHLPPLEWSVRFVDATVVPGLGARPAAVGGDQPEHDPVDVAPRDIGIEHVLYHLRLDAAGELSTHHAMHAGTALAANLVRPAR